MTMRWFIITGEYPPQHGGVSDYTQLVANGLAKAGDEGHVWAPLCDILNETDSAVTVHCLPDCFGSAARTVLDQALQQQPAGTRLLIQYVPHSFGWRAMNLPFCVWLWRQRRRHRITVMFHEVAYPWVGSGRVVRHNFLALVNRIMAWFVARSAQRVFASIPAWVDMLRPFTGSITPEWLPIPSTMPQVVDTQRVADLRTQLLGTGDETVPRQLIGHFGTFGPRYREALGDVLPSLLTRAGSRLRFLCVGRGGVEFATEIRQAHPALSDQILAAGPLAAAEVSEHLAACDLLIQPYPDGISTRRTSAMASLALGRPVLSNTGHLTEPFWTESGAVRLVGSSAQMVAAAEALLDNPPELARLCRASATLYAERFSLQRTLDRLSSPR